MYKVLGMLHRTAGAQNKMRASVYSDFLVTNLSTMKHKRIQMKARILKVFNASLDLGIYCGSSMMLFVFVLLQVRLLISYTLFSP